MGSAALWSFLPLGYLLSIAVETPVLLVGLSPRLSISRALVEHWYGERLPDPPT